MKVYKLNGYSYVTVAEVSNEEIERLNFDICKQPSETLENYYKRQTTKPTLLINCGFFNMSNGTPTGTLAIDGKTIVESGKLRSGFGLIPGNDTRLAFGKFEDRVWTDFVNGYPVLVENGAACKITYATELNYKARRTVLGFNDKAVYILCVDSPGMNFRELQKACIGLGMKYAINLDGGGSTRLLVNGVRKTSQAANRAVDNVFAIYTKTSELEADRFVRASRNLNIRSGPGASYRLNGKVATGDKLHIVAEATGTPGSAPLWGKLCDTDGWVPIGAGYTTDL